MSCLFYLDCLFDNVKNFPPKMGWIFIVYLNAQNKLSILGCVGTRDRIHGYAAPLELCH